MKNIFEGMEGNGEQGIEAMANKLLGVFMNKDLLHAPLLECRSSY